MFKNLLDNAPIAVLVSRVSDGEVLYANHKLAALAGLSLGQLIGKKTSDFYFNPSDREHVLEALRTKGKVENFELHLKRADGNPFWVETSFEPITYEGEPAIFAGYTDITERKRTEAALRESEERFRRSFEDAGVGAVIIELNGRFQQVNRAFCDMLGYSEREILRQSFAEITHSDDIEIGQEVLREMAAGERQTCHIEKRYIHKNGQIVWASVSGSVIRDTDGNALHSIAHVQDITERKHAEEASRDSEQKFRDLIETTNVIPWEGDARTFRFNYVGPQAVGSIGYAQEEWYADGFWAEHLHPEDKERSLRLCQSATAQGADHDFEYRMLGRDGRVVWLRDIVTVVSDEHGPKTLRGFLIDITERKRTEAALVESEERLRDAIESVADGFVLFDADDRVVMWNQRFAELYPELARMLPERPTAEEMFRERIRVGAVGTFDVPVDDYVRWRMEMRQKRGGTPAVHRHDDGHWFRTTERKTSEGGIVAISTDITELKTREMELSVAKEQAEFANRSKSEFLANMSHELRTPLNAVMGFSEMMQREMYGPLGDDHYKRYAKDIFDSGAHLLTVINDILDLSKIEAGKFDLNEEEVDVAQAAAACLRITEGRTKEAELSLANLLGGELPKLWADERAFKQIVLNLLSNAIKFTPAGGKVTLRAEIDEGGCFVLTVSDTGIGIGANDIPNMFAPFSQIDGSASREHQGTGLGLPLIKSLVELHGGTIELASELGGGTIATVRFPAERVIDGPASTMADDAKASAAE